MPDEPEKPFVETQVFSRAVVVNQTIGAVVNFIRLWTLLAALLTTVLMVWGLLLGDPQIVQEALAASVSCLTTLLLVRLVLRHVRRQSGGLG